MREEHFDAGGRDNDHDFFRDSLWLRPKRTIPFKAAGKEYGDSSAALKERCSTSMVGSDGDQTGMFSDARGSEV
jgi:hypothetical protein